MTDNLTKIVPLNKGNVFTIPTTKLAYCLMTNQINMNYFRVVHVYNKRLIPKHWRLIKERMWKLFEIAEYKGDYRE